MTKVRLHFIFPTICLSICMSFFAVHVEARGQSGPTVTQEDHHDTSAALSSLPQPTVASLGESHDQGGSAPAMMSSGADPVLQSSATGGAQIRVSNLMSFTGIPNRDSLFPPDPNASVGATQIVETVNSSFQVFSKSGISIFGPVEIGTIWSHFSGQCDIFSSGVNDYSDPIVLYDKLAGRWFVAAIAVANANFPNSNMICAAVSTSSDATGTYNRYAIPFGSNLPDYDKYGVWPDAYYASFNINGVPGNGASACALNRSAMLAGSTASMVCFSTGEHSMLPSDLDGSTAPASGEPSFYLDLASASSLNLFRFHVDFTDTGNSTFSGPVSISVAAFSDACGGNFACIPQGGTSQQLASLGDRLMHRLAYRNFGDHESLVVSHSVAAGSSLGVRWYEIRNITGTPFIFQQGTFAPDSNSRWMGSIAMNRAGDMEMGYSLSSSTMFPSIGTTGRFSTDPLGVMQAETVLTSGNGFQSGSNRWGDYTSMAIDPADDNTFVYTNEYYTTSGGTNWSTRISSFILAGNFSLSVEPCSQTVTAGNGFNFTVSVDELQGTGNITKLSASNLPTGATAVFNPTSVTGSGTSVMSLSTSTSTPPGMSTVVIAGNDGTNTQDTAVTLTVAASGTPGTGTVTISGFEKAFCPSSCGRFCSRSCAEYDQGQVTVTVGNASWSAGYGQGSTGLTIAQGLANLFNNDCTSPVNATVSGSTITFTARAYGAATNYSISAGSYSLDPGDFPTPSFSGIPSGSTMTGGS